MIMEGNEITTGKYTYSSAYSLSCLKLDSSGAKSSLQQIIVAYKGGRWFGC